MMNDLSQRSAELTNMRHTPILRQLRQAIQAAKSDAGFLGWRAESPRLVVEANALARAVVTSRKWESEGLINLPRRGQSETCTLPSAADEKAQMRTEFHALAAEFAGAFEDVAHANNMPPRDFARSLLGTVQGTSPFGNAAPQASDELRRTFSASRQRLTFDRPHGADGRSAAPLLHWHKVTLRIHVTEDTVHRLGAGVRAWLDARLPAGDRAEVHALVDEKVSETAPEAEFVKLLRLLDTQTVGQLKKAAMLTYLDAFHEQLVDVGDEVGERLLGDLRRRLRLLEAYLMDDVRGDAEFDVACAGATYNLRTLFAQADAFDDLPVVPICDGVLGESTDWKNGMRTYVFGVKLKLNGQVARFDKLSSFDYHLALLQGRYPTRPERLLRLAVLYAVVFPHLGDTAHDSITYLRDIVLPVLQQKTSSGLVAGGSSDGANEASENSGTLGQIEVDAATLALCQDIATACAKAPIPDLARSMRALLTRETQREAYTRQVKISVRGGIVETRRGTVLNEGRLLRDLFVEDREREALRYIEVVDAGINRNAILSIPADIVIEDVHCYEASAVARTCTMHHDPRATQMLSVVLRADVQKRLPASRSAPAPASLSPHRPAAPAPGLEIAAQITAALPVAGRNGRPVSYFRQSPVHWLVYWYVFSVVAYLGIQVVAAYADLPFDELFVSLVRLHQAEEDDPDDAEGMIAMLGKTMAQVISTDWLANTQGLRLQTESRQPETFRVRNAAASLYATLPKTFTFDQQLPDVLPRLAIVAVSSRKSDSLKADLQVGFHRATVYGEVSAVERTTPTTVRVRRVGTFTSTYDSDEIYSKPDVILNEISRLYRQGFRHVLYIAEAPYSSRLHLTRDRAPDATGMPPSETQGTGDGLFFLSPTILANCLEQRDDLHIYPIFRDQYAAMRFRTPTAKALYIQDVGELLQVVNDTTQHMAVFLNLFSGEGGVAQRGSARGEVDEHYNGVVSYATLLNSYGGILNERDLRAALIHDEGGQNRLKDQLVLYLSLFHLSRYQVARRDIALKLDPFEDLIGVNSVGHIAARQHVHIGMRFNYLSFLAEVRNITRERATHFPAAGKV